jgi:isoleucyl-tRNA synthetase
LTLPSNTALLLGPKIDYVLVKTFNQYTFLPANVILAKKFVKTPEKDFFVQEKLDFEF